MTIVSVILGTFRWWFYFAMNYILSINKFYDIRLRNTARECFPRLPKTVVLVFHKSRNDYKYRAERRRLSYFFLQQLLSW